ncbi:MAG: efflux RND transporter permease subunit [Simkaniaceae bacterium]|nr:efflux RND transporter permease subunit [Simkaniaceae bacterium]
MNVSKIFILRPVMTSLVMLSILFFGIASYRSLPVSSLPYTSYPTITVSTSYPGADPETVSDTITSPLEKELTEITGIRNISSTSSHGASTIILEFIPSRHIDLAAQDVREAIDRTSGSLPSDLPHPPAYRKFNTSGDPVILYAIRSDRIPEGELSEYGYSLLGRRLNTVQGVAGIVIDGPDFAVRVRVDPEILAAHDLGIDEVAQAITESNPQKPVGTLFGKEIRRTLVVKGQIPDAAGYEQVAVRNKGGALVKLKDLGRVYNSVANERIVARYHTKGGEMPALFLGVIKQTDADTVTLAKECRRRMEEIKKDLPGDVIVSEIFDEAKWINEAVDEVNLTLFIAFGLVIVTVLFCLGTLIDTIIPVISLPITVIGTFAMIYLYGFTIDILSLLAITLSIGFLIDDAIVVLENVARHAEGGKSPLQAALDGSKQIGTTILSMTLSLATVFIPMIFMPGILGNILREFSITVITGVMISGVISLSLTPLLCSRFLRVRKTKNSPLKRLSDTINGTFLKGYEYLLLKALNKKLVILLGGIAATIIVIVGGFFVPKDLLPADDIGFIRGVVRTSDMTSPLKTRDKQEEVARIIRQDPAVKNVITVSPDSNRSHFYVSLNDAGKRGSTADVMTRLTEKTAHIPDIKLFMRPIPLMNLDIPTGATTGTYQYTLQGFDTEKPYRDVAALIRKMEAHPFFGKVNSDIANHGAYVTLKIDRDRASSLNVTAEGLETALGLAYGEGQLTLINESSGQYRVILEVLRKDDERIGDLRKLYVSTTTNTRVPLSELVTVEETTGPLSIAHSDTVPSATLSFNLAPGVPLGKGIRKLREITREVLSPGVTAKATGATGVFEEVFGRMNFLFCTVLFLIYVILGILYEDFIMPVAIMSSIPPAGLGIVLTLLCSGTPFSLYAFIGTITVLGIVLKNGIIIVDFANESIRSGVESTEAIRRACLHRLRPILMTTFAAMAGAVSIALGVGGGSVTASRKSLGLTVIGGLLLSQPLILFFTPVILLYLNKLREKRGTKRDRTPNRRQPG